jgi:hypothetical protein
MRAIIRCFDRFARWARSVFEFCDDPQCILRLRLTQTPRELHLPGGVVRRGEPMLEIHLWNEHLPSLPPDGPDLAWGLRMGRMWILSLRRAGQYVRGDPRLSAVRAVGGVTVLLFSGDHFGGIRLMERSGFTVEPHRHSLGRFGEFWQNLYVWGLMWAFNPASIRGRRLIHLRQAEMWMPADEFLRRYG